MGLEIIGGNYVELDGISGGQTIIGGTDASDDLTLQSTSHATKGKILFGSSAYDEVNNRLGIGTTTPAVALEISGDGKLSFTTGNPAECWMSSPGTRQFRFTMLSAENSYFTFGRFYDATLGAYIKFDFVVRPMLFQAGNGKPIGFSANRQGFGAGIYIDPDQNVGIGTKTPGQVLDVEGNCTINGNIYYGDDISGGNITLMSTSNATKGKILFGTSAYDEVNNRLGIGTVNPGYLVDVVTTNAGNTNILSVDNLDNTNTASHSYLKAATGGASGGNPALHLSNRVVNWIIGIDNSDGDKLKIAYSNAIGTDDRFTMLSNGFIGLGTTAPATSAMLDLTTTTGALLITRMTTTQRDALTAVNGMIIYNTTTTAFNFRENGAWVTK